MPHARRKSNLPRVLRAKSGFVRVKPSLGLHPFIIHTPCERSQRVLRSVPLGARARRLAALQTREAGAGLRPPPRNACKVHRIERSHAEPSERSRGAARCGAEAWLPAESSAAGRRRARAGAGLSCGKRGSPRNQQPQRRRRAGHSLAARGSARLEARAIWPTRRPPSRASILIQSNCSRRSSRRPIERDDYEPCEVCPPSRRPVGSRPPRLGCYL